MNASVISQSKRREENCPGKYSRGLRNQNEEHLINLCESNILETQVIFPIKGQNFLSVFPVESTNDINIKITPKSFSYRRCMHLGMNITYEFLQSQSVFNQVLNAVSDVCLKKENV